MIHVDQVFGGPASRASRARSFASPPLGEFALS